MKKNIPFTPLVIGVDGLIGGALWNYFSKQISNSYGTSRKGTDGLPYLDLQKPDLKSLKIDLSLFTHAIIAGANSNIADCERSPLSTHSCNVEGPLNLTHQLRAAGILPVLFSTDYVFNGIQGAYTEEDPLSPLNEYGRQKAELEKKIDETCSGYYLLIRLTKVFFKQLKGKGLLGEISDKLRQNQKIRAATDLIFSPILLDDVVSGIVSLLSLGARGLYNLGGIEKWSRYDLAIELARQIKADPNLVEPILIDDLNESFKRPKRTDLICHKFTEKTGISPLRLSEIIQENA